ncbi:42010_t:CDS:2, partial [Gigaspora margarita]
SNVSKISAFNIKKFGKAKLLNHKVMKIIFKIFERYDIVLCQEVRLSVEMINQFVFSLSKSSSIPYSYVSSQPIGRAPYVVRFQNLNKPHVRITLVGCHTHP